jgi:precorrin-3B synthase
MPLCHAARLAQARGQSRLCTGPGRQISSLRIHMPNTHEPKGFCPSVWAPMQSGDGQIVRVHTGACALSSAQARALGRLARTHGNGQIELTRRANVQLRGVSEAGLGLLQSELVLLGLAEPSPELERRLSVLVSPLSSLSGFEDLASLGGDVRTALREARAVDTLPGKFAIVIDGEPALLRELGADIRVELRGDHQDVAHLSVDSAIKGAGSHWLGACRLLDVPHAVVLLASALSDAGGSRMRQLVAARGIEHVRALLLRLLVASPTSSLPPERPLSLLGVHAHASGWAGLAVPFGAAHAAQFEAMASLAERYGAGELRVTHRRSIILPGVRRESGAALLAEAQAHGLLVDEHDPLLRVTACSGAPACSSALHETRGSARELSGLVAPLLELGSTLHVSGCAKSCARDGSSGITVVHTPEGVRFAFDSDVRQALGAPALSMPELHQQLSQHALDPTILARAEGSRPTLEQAASK